MDTKHALGPAAVPAGCQNCHFASYCQVDKKAGLERHLFGKISVKIRKYEREDYIYRANDPFKTLYVIRSGSVKTYTFIQNGMEQVTGFHLTGKLLGLDGVGNVQHSEAAIALETSSICEIPYSKLESLRKQDPRLQSLLWYAMSNEIRDEYEHLRLLTRASAAARLACFLLCLSNCFQQRGYSSSNFNLSLSRHDIANLLGLAVETVSRLLTQFHEEGLVSVDRKHIVLEDMESLKRLSNANNEYVRHQLRPHTRHSALSHAQ